MHINTVTLWYSMQAKIHINQMVFLFVFHIPVFHLSAIFSLTLHPSQFVFHYVMTFLSTRRG